MADRLAYKIIFTAVGLLATSSVIFVYARYWSRGESAPIPLVSSIGMIFMSVMNVVLPIKNRGHLALKGVLAALTLVAVIYMMKIGLR